MKRIATIGAAALMLAGPLAATASAQDWRGDRDGRYDRRDNDRRDYDRRDNDRRDWNRRDNDRRAVRWDQRRHNGYYLNGRFYRGAPPAWAYQRHDFRPAYQSWRRGDRLPSYYRSHYRQVDWRRERLRQPPRGYHYVRDDNSGEYLLVGIATGVILSILLSQ